VIAVTGLVCILIFGARFQSLSTFDSSDGSRAHKAIMSVMELGIGKLIPVGNAADHSQPSIESRIGRFAVYRTRKDHPVAGKKGISHFTILNFYRNCILAILVYRNFEIRCIRGASYLMDVEHCGYPSIERWSIPEVPYGESYFYIQSRILSFVSNLDRPFGNHVGFKSEPCVNADEKVIRFSRSRPAPVIRREPRSTGTR
jgi:hypothetical protein